MHKDIKKHYKTSFLDIFFIKIFNKAYFSHQTPLKQDKKTTKKAKWNHFLPYLTIDI